jgi:hypothetical protein
VTTVYEPQAQRKRASQGPRPVPLDTRPTPSADRGSTPPARTPRRTSREPAPSARERSTGAPPRRGDTRAGRGTYAIRRRRARPQGHAISRGPTARRGDRRRHACGRRTTQWRPGTGPDRRLVAGGPSDLGGSRPWRGRPRSSPRRTPGSPGKGGKRREVGMDEWGWEHLRPGWTFGRACRSGPSLRDERPNPVSTVVWSRDTDQVSPPRGEGEDPSPVCASPVAPRSRGRDGARGRAAECDPGLARSRGPRCHLGPSPGDRQHRGDRRGSRTQCADHVGERGTVDVGRELRQPVLLFAKQKRSPPLRLVPDRESVFN